MCQRGHEPFTATRWKNRQPPLLCKFGNQARCEFIDNLDWVDVVVEMCKTDDASKLSRYVDHLMHFLASPFDSSRMTATFFDSRAKAEEMPVPKPVRILPQVLARQGAQ